MAMKSSDAQRGQNRRIFWIGQILFIAWNQKVSFDLSKVTAKT